MWRNPEHWIQDTDLSLFPRNEIATTCYIQNKLKLWKINKSSYTAPKWIRRSTHIHIHGCIPSCLPPFPQGKEPSNPLGEVHAIVTANVPVDNTLHNKQTGEGGRANLIKRNRLSQNGSLFNCSINSTNKSTIQIKAEILNQAEIQNKFKLLESQRHQRSH